MKNETKKFRFNIFYKDIDYRIYIVAVGSLISLIFAHLFGIVTILKKGDNFIMKGYGATVRSGRWGLEILEKLNKYLFTIYNLEYLNSLLALIILSITIYYIIKIFDLKNPIFVALFTMIFHVFPTTTSTLLYSFTVVPYFIGLFLSVYAVYLIEKYKNGWTLGILLLIFSMGIYQSYITVTISLFGIILLMKSITGEYDLKQTIRRTLLYLSIFIITIISYILISKLFIILYNTSFTSYKGIDSMGKIDIKQLPYLFVKIYKDLIKMILPKRYSIIAVPPVFPTLMLKLSVVSLILLSMIFIIKHTIKNKDIINRNRGISIIIALLLPIPLYSQIIMSPKSYIHILMIFSIALIFIVPMLLFENLYETNEKIYSKLNKALITIFSIVIIQYTYLANLNYTTLYYSTQKSTNYIQSLVVKMTEQEGFDTKLKWAFLGTENDELIRNTGDLKDADTYMPNMNGLIFNLGYLDGSKPIDLYIGYNPTWASEKEKKELIKIDEIKDMPIYPNYGSIKIYEDYIIVKFNESME